MWVIIIATTLALLLGSESESQSEEKGWQYSEHIDKLTRNKTFRAQAHLFDNEVPLLLTEVTLICDRKRSKSSISQNGEISIEFTTFNRNAKDEQLSGTRLVGIHESSFLGRTFLFLAGEVRSDSEDPRQFNGAVTSYNNSFSVSVQDLDELGHMSEGGFLFISKSAREEIVLRFATEHGAPIIVIPLQDASIKKVAAQCGWNLDK